MSPENKRPRAICDWPFERTLLEERARYINRWVKKSSIVYIALKWSGRWPSAKRATCNTSPLRRQVYKNWLRSGPSCSGVELPIAPTPLPGWSAILTHAPSCLLSIWAISSTWKRLRCHHVPYASLCRPFPPGNVLLLSSWERVGGTSIQISF